MVTSPLKNLVATNCVKCGRGIWAFILQKERDEELRKARCPRCDRSSKWHLSR